MEKVIHKIKLEPDRRGSNSIPLNAKFLKVGVDCSSDICVWYEVSKKDIGSSDTKRFAFTIIPTGSPFIDDGLTYIDTVFLYSDGLVFHIYSHIEDLK